MLVVVQQVQSSICLFDFVLAMFHAENVLIARHTHNCISLLSKFVLTVPIDGNTAEAWA